MLKSQNKTQQVKQFCTRVADQMAMHLVLQNTGAISAMTCRYISHFVHLYFGIIQDYQTFLLSLQLIPYFPISMQVYEFSTGSEDLLFWGIELLFIYSLFIFFEMICCYLFTFYLHYSILLRRVKNGCYLLICWQHRFFKFVTLMSKG